MPTSIRDLRYPYFTHRNSKTSKAWVFFSKFRQTATGTLTYPSSLPFSDENESYTSTANKNAQKCQEFHNYPLKGGK